MNLSPDGVRSLMIECLRKERPRNPGERPFDVDRLLYEMAEIAKNRELKTAGGLNAWADLRNGAVELHPHIRVDAWNVVWDLIIEGVLRPGYGEQSHTLPQIHVTPHGKESIN